LLEPLKIHLMPVVGHGSWARAPETAVLDTVGQASRITFPAASFARGIGTPIKNFEKCKATAIERPNASLASAAYFEIMDRRHSMRGPRARRSSYAGGIAYVLFCACTVLAGTTLTVTGFVFAPRDVQAAQQVPVARIQFVPDRNDLCRVLLFHNDSGRYQDAGRGPCSNQISENMLVWTSRGSRIDAFAQAFRPR
jgi:hypothetical protein